MLDHCASALSWRNHGVFLQVIELQCPKHDDSHEHLYWSTICRLAYASDQRLELGDHSFVGSFVVDGILEDAVGERPQGVRAGRHGQLNRNVFLLSHKSAMSGRRYIQQVRT